MTLVILEVLPPVESPSDCNVTDSNLTCAQQMVTPYLPTRGDSIILATPSRHNPVSSQQNWTDDLNIPRKIILRWTQYYGKPWVVPKGSAIFHNLDCPVTTCILSDDRTLLNQSDAILVHMRDVQSPKDLPKHRRLEQRWVFYLLESPYHTAINLTLFNGYFNWTSTYSSESDIPSPYGSFRYYDSTDVGNHTSVNVYDEYPGKTRTAAWFVTNCKAQNRRQEYVEDLKKYVPVDVYGNCGQFKCRDREKCLEMLRRKYKFYIAFENSNCREYITEKLWYNALDNDIVPIVLGPPKRDYERVAPPGSYIHVNDFKTPHDLVRYLRILHKDKRLYRQYFKWQELGKAVTEINMDPMKSQFWCNLCAALHDTSLPSKTHHHLDTWWSVENQCKGVDRDAANRVPRRTSL